MDNAAQTIRAGIIDRLVHTMNGAEAEEIVKHAETLANFVINGAQSARKTPRKAKTIRRKK